MAKPRSPLIVRITVKERRNPMPVFQSNLRTTHNKMIVTLHDNDRSDEARFRTIPFFFAALIGTGLLVLFQQQKQVQVSPAKPRPPNMNPILFWNRGAEQFQR
jgi:hypothetical protein